MKNKFVQVLLAVVVVFSLFGTYQSINAFADNAEQIVYSQEESTSTPLKIVGVIPARYASSRFPGKPLADICGKPMVWWVYQQAKKVPELSEVYVATDDERIEAVCKQYNMDVIMTSKDHPNHIARVQEISNKVQADYYICINGDEPLIDPENISAIIPLKKNNGFYFGGAMRKIIEAPQVLDYSNIKITTGKDGQCIYMSRSPIPYPKGTLNFQYNKYVGIECFNKASLDYFVCHDMGQLEKIEDIDHLRFIENNMPLLFSYVKSDSISVDTTKDLDFVRTQVGNKLKKN